MHRPARQSTPSRARLAAALALGALPLTACDKTETRTVAQIKSEYAHRFVQGLDFGLAGRIKAESFDPDTFTLANVNIDDNPQRIYHAELAEIHVSPDADTIVLEFVAITGADTTHGITETPVATTPPVKLPYDIVP